MMNFGNMLKGFFGNIFEGKFGQLPAGVCNISMSGRIAVKTNNGYKSFSTPRKKLVNTTGFAFDMGPGSFFLIPVKKTKEGDIVTVKQGQVTKFYAVTEPENEAHPNTIKMFDFETNDIVEKVPERHVLMDKTYYFGKVASMWDMIFKGGLKSEGGFNGIMAIMAMQKMFGRDKGFGFGTDTSSANSFLDLIMMNAITGGSLKSAFGGEIGQMFLMQSLMGKGANNSDPWQFLMMSNLLKHSDQDSEGINDLFGGFFGDIGGKLFCSEEEEDAQAEKQE